MPNNISVSVVGDVKDINKKLSDTNSKLDGFGKTASKIGSGLKSAFAVSAVIGGIKALGSVLGDTVGAARESAKVTALTEQVIKTMGNQANISADGVANLSTAISNKTGVDDEAIQSGANLVLTFGNIKNAAGAGNDVFNQTVALANDMSVALGQDMKSSSIQLGKALNDPIKGVSALSKVGVSFTEQQKEQIKTLTESGNVLGAQQVILKEVGKQFGGAAAAAATPWDKFKTTMGNVQESIGAKLIPVIDRLLNGFLKNMPSYVASASKAWEGLKGAFVTIQPVLATIFGLFQSAGSFLLAHKTVLEGIAIAVAALGAAYVVYQGVLLGITVVQTAWNVAQGVAKAATAVWTAVQWLLNTAMYGFPLVWILAAILAVIAIIVLAIKYHKQIAAAVVAAWNAVKSATVTAWNAVKSAIGTAINAVKTAVGSALGAIKTAVSTAWNAVKTATSTAWNSLKGLVTTAFSNVKSAVTSGINDAIALVRGIGGKVKGAIGNLGGILKGAGREIIQGLIDGVTGMIGSLKDKFASITSLIPSWKGPINKDKKLLTPAGEAIMNGLMKGIDSRLPALRKTLGGVSSIIRSGINGDFDSQGVGLTNSISSRGAVGTAAPIYLTVNAPVGSSPAKIGKELVTYLQAHDATYGTRWRN